MRATTAEAVVEWVVTATTMAWVAMKEATAVTTKEAEWVTLAEEATWVIIILAGTIRITAATWAVVRTITTEVA